MGRIFKDLDFAKAARKARISDEALRIAVNEADAGLVDAYLGGELVKKRVARPGAGKREGFRTILVFRRNERAFFVHMFAKKRRGEPLAARPRGPEGLRPRLAGPHGRWD